MLGELDCRLAKSNALLLVDMSFQIFAEVIELFDLPIYVLNGLSNSILDFTCTGIDGICPSVDIIQVLEQSLNLQKRLFKGDRIQRLRLLLPRLPRAQGARHFQTGSQVDIG